jgi:hypothetical protein
MSKMKAAMQFVAAFLMGRGRALEFGVNESLRITDKRI